MRYSLISRFHGTLLGAAIAEGLESNLGKSKSEAHPLQHKLSSHSAEAQGQQLFQLNRIVWLYANTLIQAGDLDVGYLQLQIRQQAQTQTALLSPTETLVGVIPVSLFFHEDEARLQQKVLEAMEVEPTALELQSEALAVAYGIAQCLREQLDSTTFIPRTIAYLNQSSNNILVKHLEQVHKLLEQRVSLETLLQRLGLHSSNSLPVSASIALALYCFLSTSEDYWLTVARAARIGSALTVILAGALSGAYNSTAGIPPRYRLALLQGDFEGVQTQTFAEKIQLIADQLLATWSGAYEPTQGFGETNLLAKPAIAAPGVIRPR